MRIVQREADHQGRSSLEWCGSVSRTAACSSSLCVRCDSCELDHPAPILCYTVQVSRLCSFLMPMTNLAVSAVSYSHWCNASVNVGFMRETTSGKRFRRPRKVMFAHLPHLLRSSGARTARPCESDRARALFSLLPVLVLGMSVSFGRCKSGLPSTLHGDLLSC